jgi:hypothetical protein
LLVVVAASFAALTAGAAQAQSRFTVTCPHGFPNPGEGPGVGIGIFSPSGILLHGRFYDCDEGTRYSTIVPGLPARVDYSCWNGFIFLGGGSAAKGSCVDSITGKTIAKWAIRLPKLEPYAAPMEACSLIGGTFEAPGVNVADFGLPPPTGYVLMWTCNAWPYGLTPAPVPSTWGGYCSAGGAQSYMLITSNQPLSGLTGISCYNYQEPT